MVSLGEADATRAEGFRSPVVLDESFEAGNAFGAGGTPMAVLLDEHGRIASSVAAGGEAVLALAGCESRETGNTATAETNAGAAAVAPAAGPAPDA